MTNNTASDKLTARIAGMATALLEVTYRDLSARPKLDEAERLVSARLADELTRRWDIDEELDVVFSDLEFTGSYYEAMLLAKAAKAAQA